MPASLLREAPAPASMVKHARRMGGFVLLAASGAALGLLAIGALAGPSFVDQVRVANPTEYAVHVRASNADASWLGLGVVGPGEERTFQHVIDQGDTWIFEFSYAGEVAGHVEVDADARADGGWGVEVPADVGLLLGELGFSPRPPGF